MNVYGLLHIKVAVAGRALPETMRVLSVLTKETAAVKWRLTAPRFVRKRDQDVNVPGSVARGVRASPRVVSFNSPTLDVRPT